MVGYSKIPQSRVEKRSFNGGSSMSSASMDNGVKVCHCGRKAAIRTSKTQRNPGRAFYTCPLPKAMKPVIMIEDMDSAECEPDMDAWMKNHLNFKFRVLGTELRNVRNIVIAIGCLMAVMILL
ncbi:Zinc finger, GRF-type [Sesbania bispinosa]|nr:Zinc finger, GRF-type [Sesbania bispinosa]